MLDGDTSPPYGTDGRESLCPESPSQAEDACEVDKVEYVDSPIGVARLVTCKVTDFWSNFHLQHHSSKALSVFVDFTETAPVTRKNSAAGF